MSHIVERGSILTCVPSGDVAYYIAKHVDYNMQHVESIILLEVQSPCRQNALNKYPDIPVVVQI